MVCESGNLATALFKSVSAGIIVVDASTKKILDINPAASVMIGLSREDVLGRVCYEHLCVEDCDGCPVLTAESQDGDEIVENQEIRLMRRDGSVVYAWLTINSALIEGRRVFINTLIDISRQKEAEHLLLEHLAYAERTLDDNIVRIQNGVV
jgi:PAS domain S-box-containing protein